MSTSSALSTFTPHIVSATPPPPSVSPPISLASDIPTAPQNISLPDAPMYVSLYEQQLRTMTAAAGEQTPTLDVLGKLPTVQMSLSEPYRASDKSRAHALEVLRSSIIARPKSPVDFERRLPGIVTGEDPDWELWRVDFYIAWLTFSYVNKNAIREQSRFSGSTAPSSISHFRSCAYAYLVSPPSIGLDFEIPELGWRISWEMNNSSPTGSHSILYNESLRGQPTGSFSYKIPAIIPIIPTATRGN